MQPTYPIQYIPQTGDEIDSIYNTFMSIKDCANNEDNVGRYFVHAPIFDEPYLPNILDEVELPREPPLSTAVAAVRRHGYRVIVDKLKIPGQP